LVNNPGLSHYRSYALSWASSERQNKEPTMHKSGWERLLISLFAFAIALNLLAASLPRLIPYIVVLAVIFVVVRLVLFHTRNW
jgi:Flp pilus assembly protein TadB